ncbi:thiamine-phosphate pyrophosphorylase, partial [Lacticaseibacillus rhamnosus]
MNAEALQLYLVTNRYADSPEVFLAKIAAACENGVTMVQLREKSLTTRDYYALAKQVKLITDRYRIPLIIDDRVDVCLAVDAAGVHIGDDELPVAVTRQLLGSDKIWASRPKQLRLPPLRLRPVLISGWRYFPTQTKAAAPLTSLATLKAITAAV